MKVCHRLFSRSSRQQKLDQILEKKLKTKPTESASSSSKGFENEYIKLVKLMQTKQREAEEGKLLSAEELKETAVDLSAEESDAEFA